jgi:excisionase family DNA binding protein
LRHRPTTNSAMNGTSEMEDSANESPLLKVDEAAVLLRCKSCTVRALIKRGSLPFVPVGRLVFLRRSAVLEWIERHETRKKLDTFRPQASVNR